MYEICAGNFYSFLFLRGKKEILHFISSAQIIVQYNTYSFEPEPSEPESHDTALATILVSSILCGSLRLRLCQTFFSSVMVGGW
jgi:hypothetical protein